MFSNNTKESRRFLSLALLGILVFVSVIILRNVPERIQRGQQAAAAIQMLDAIRRPLLAIETAELQTEKSSSKSNTHANFEQHAANAQTMIKRYQNASRYNPRLVKNVDALAVLIDKWIQAEQAEREQPVEDQSLASVSQRRIEDRERLLAALTLLAAGEAPIHDDIEQGLAAEHLLQWGGVSLIIYLFLLIIFFLRVRQREILRSYQALEQVRTELQQRENYLALTLNSIGDAVIATDEQGYIIRMNPVAENLTGWRQKEANGHPLPDVFRIVNVHSRQPVDNPVEKVLSSGQIVGLANHTVLIAKDGREYQIADSGAPIMDEEEKILGVILVFRDITEEYQQQEALHKSQRNLAEAQQLAHIGNWELDLISNTLTWSDEIFRIFELDIDKFQPSYEAFLDRIHPGDRKQVNQAYMDSLKNGVPYDLTHRLLMKDGRIKYIHEYCKTQFDDNNRPLFSIGVVQDISERRKIENELIKTAHEWKQAMDSIDDAIYLVDLDDRIMRANKTFYQLTGLQPEQVIGQDINRILHPQGETVPCPVCRARKAREDTQIIMEADHPDNPTARPIEIMLKIIRNEQEEPVSILMVIHDLTTQREIENKLLQHQDYLEAEIEKRTAALSMINKELESFSYSISHDLRAPLRSINGFAVALREDYADSLDNIANDYLQRISAGADRMSELIDDLLMLSRINRQELNKNTCNLSCMASEIRQQLAEQYPRNNLQWKIQQQLNIRCDANLIRIALENMFSNALKYSSKKSHAVIEFGCEQQDGKNIFYIRDNGAGFDMQYSDKLFGAFQRLHGKEFDGIGIGLATVQRIIHRHGGKIWAEAEVDKGATFYFTLD